MNPVLWLELRVRVRERKLWIVSLLFLLCLLVMACVSVFGMGRGFNEEAPSRVGQPLGYANAFCLLALLLILGPLAGAGRIAQEREQRTLAGLLNTPLSPAGIVWGKLAATWCFVLWLGALSLPFFVTASLWGGFSARRLLGSMAVAVIAGMTTATLAVGLSGFFNRSLTSYLTTGAVMFFWIAAWPLLGTFVGEFWSPADSHAREVFQTTVSYVFFNHNPATAMMATLGLHRDDSMGDPLHILCYALTLWTALGAGAFRLAMRGLKRGLSDRL